jgi:hypothetical protein
MVDLTIQFATKEQAIAFSTWLREAGEQEYWLWAEILSRRGCANDYVASFDYGNGLQIKAQGCFGQRQDPLTEA